MKTRLIETWFPFAALPSLSPIFLGLKKGLMIKQALLHHLQAIDEFPEEFIIPPRLVVTSASGERQLERLESQEAPNRAMRELFGEDPGYAHSDAL